MTPRRELLAFAAALAALLGGFFGESLFGGKILSPADVVYAQASFRTGDGNGEDYEPSNRLLIDPVLQFQPWIEFNRAPGSGNSADMITEMLVDEGELPEHLRAITP